MFSDDNLFEVDLASSVRAALKIIEIKNVDILILDIQLPCAVGGDVDELGGIELLTSIEERLDKLEMPNLVIGVTSHEESRKAASDFFTDRGFPLLSSSEVGIRLKQIVKNRIRYLQPTEEFDVAIITALQKTEFEQIKRLPFNFVEGASDDCHTYYYGEFKDENNITRNVVATCCTRMGSTSSAVTSSLVINRFNPKIVIMTGIAAGIKGKTQFGDIVVAESCWDWESGKRTVKDNLSIFRSASDSIPLDRTLKSVFNKISVERLYLEEIQNQWQLGAEMPRLNVHVSPMVSGSSVLEDPELVDSILEQHRKITAIEMEAYGIALSAQIAPSQPKWLVVKSVCDFADTEKNDNYQVYAAFTSSQLVYRVLSNQFGLLGLS